VIKILFTGQKDSAKQYIYAMGGRNKEQLRKLTEKYKTQKDEQNK
jgi:hypothetical protein